MLNPPLADSRVNESSDPLHSEMPIERPDLPIHYVSCQSQLACDCFGGLTVRDAALAALRPGTPFWSRRVSLLISSTLPTLLSPTTPPSPTTSFALVHALGLFVVAGHWTESVVPDSRMGSSTGHGPGFAQRSQARRSTWLNRVYVASCLACHVVTDGLFTSGSSPPRVATTQ